MSLDHTPVSTGGLPPRHLAADIKARMADDIVILSRGHAEGVVTEKDLERAGWSKDQIKTHGDAASAIALKKSGALEQADQAEENEENSRQVFQPARRPAPTMLPQGIRLLCEGLVEHSSLASGKVFKLEAALKDSDLTITRLRPLIESLRSEAREMHVLGDAISHKIADIQKREPLRGVKG